MLDGVAVDAATDSVCQAIRDCCALQIARHPIPPAAWAILGFEPDYRAASVIHGLYPRLRLTFFHKPYFDIEVREVSGIDIDFVYLAKSRLLQVAEDFFDRDLCLRSQIINLFLSHGL